MLQPPEYTCPLCKTPLEFQQARLCCKQNHSFDYAKEGYVHLLPVQMKNSMAPGDDKNMVLARREFLAQGFYEFLRQALATEVSKRAPSVLVDLGCGEGYYTSHLQTSFPDSQVYGIDISKPAVKYAAKRNPNVHYAVATNAHLPFDDDYVDVIVNVFAPLIGQECRRILGPNGHIISVSPGPRHLEQLKAAIYERVELHDTPQPLEGFTVSTSQQIDRTVTLESAQSLENLLVMTPFGWKITPQKKLKLLASVPFQVTLSFIINTYS